MSSDFPGYKIPAEQAELWWSPDFLKLKEANSLFEMLREQVEWEQGQILMFGKWVTKVKVW